MGGALDGGNAFVRILPDMSGFGARLQQGVTRGLKGHAPAIARNVQKFIVLPLLAGAAAGTKMAVDVEKGLREVNTLFGVTGKEAERSFVSLQDNVSALSNEIGVAQTTLISGLYQAVSAGVPRKNAFQFLRVSAQAAIAGVTDTETAIDGLTTIINAFGLKTDSVQMVADSMFQTVKGGKTTFEELSAAIFQAAPLAAAAGVSFQEVNAAIATLTAAGVPTSVATTQIRSAIVALEKPNKQLAAAIEEAGFASKNAAIEQLGLGGTLALVAKHSERTGVPLQQYLGRVEAVAATNVLAGTGAAKFAAELEAQEDSAGAATTAFLEMEKSASRKLTKGIEQLKNVLIDVGRQVIPLVVKGAKAFGAVFQFLSRHGRIVGSVIAGIVSGLIAYKIATIAASLVTVLFGKTAAAAWVAAAGPIGLLVAAVVAAGVAIFVFRDQIWNALKAIGKFFADIFGTILPIIKAAFAPVVLYFKVWFKIVSTIFKIGWKIIKALFDVFWAAFGPPIKVVFGGLVAFFRTMFGVLRRVFGAGFGAMKWVWEHVLRPVFGAIRRVWNGVIGAWRNGLGALRDFFVGVWDRIKSAFLAVVVTILRGIKMLVDGVGKVTSVLKKVPGLGALVPDIAAAGSKLGDIIGSLQAIQSGGAAAGRALGADRLAGAAAGANIAAPGLLRVGEKGEEVVDLPKGARVTPLDKVGTAKVAERIEFTQVATTPAEILAALDWVMVTRG